MRKLLMALMLMSLPALSIAKNGQLNPAGQKQGLHFIENSGQVHDQNLQPRTDIDFTVSGKGMSLFIGDGQMHYQFRTADKTSSLKDRLQTMKWGNQHEKISYNMYRVDVELIGANKQAEVIKEEKQAYVQNYYTITGRKFSEPKKEAQGFQAYSYNKITYKDIYPNIDWVIFIKGEQVEYEFVVKQGGNPADIKLKYNGTTSVKKNKDGSITAKSPLGDITEAAPYSYQRDGQKVNSAFALDNNVLSFNIGQYSGELVIDPIIYWGTYYGSTGDEQYNHIQNDWAGGIFSVGFTTSISNMATLGAYQTISAGGQDALITKFDTAGDVVWSTFYGSIGDDNIVQGSVDLNDGSIYVCGSTDAGGSDDVIFAHFSPTGAFIYDAVIGDPLAADYGNAVRVDINSQDVYFGGMSSSFSAMATLNSYHPTNQGLQDGFLTKVDALGNVIWSTYIGGPSNENVSAIAVDEDGNVYPAGSTNSLTGISGWVLPVYGGGNFDAYVMGFNAAGAWQWGTYCGASGDDMANGIEVSPFEELIMVGSTTSIDLQNVGGFMQNTYGGNTDGYYARLSIWGSLLSESYYGGSNFDAAYGISWDGGSTVLWGGYTESNDLLYTNDGFQTTYSGGGDGFMVRNTPLFTGYGWCSYYGGTGEDGLTSVAYGEGYSMYAGGVTNSSNGIAVNTNTQQNLSGGYDGCMARIEECLVLPASGTINGPTNVCAGTTQTYTANPIIGALGYTWTLPNGWTGTSTTNTITVTVGNTSGAVTVVGNDACGNNGTPTTLNVTVNAAPTASITAAGPTTFCQGGNVVLNSNTGLGFTYQWYQGTTQVGTNSSSYTATASGNYTVQITGGGCTTTSNMITVTVNPAPNATASSNSPVCVGQTINLNGGSTTPGASYSWLGPLVFGSGVEDPTIPNAQPGNAGVYTLTVTANGCTNTATTTVVVTAGAPATPSAINGDISICEFTTNTYDVANDPNAGSYTWTLPTGWTGSSTTNSISATAGAAGGQISVTATNGCGTSSVATLNVTVTPNPVAVITQSGNTLNVTGTYTSYQWFGPSGLIAGATSPSYTATTSGNYYCVVTDANGCEDESNTIVITVSVNNVAKVSTVNLYPNPNQGSFTIEGAFASNDGKANVVIVDVAGRVVYQQQVAVNNGKLSARIDMNNTIASGVYTIKVSSDAANTIIPFVKN